MKNIAMIFVIVFAFVCPVYGFTEPVTDSSADVTILTGGDGSLYTTFVTNYMRKGFKAIPSEGSLDNLNRLLNGEADAAIVQLNVINDNQGQKLQIVKRLFREYVHFIYKKGGQYDSFNSLEGKNVNVCVGSLGGGTGATFLNLINLDKGYASITPIDRSGISALAEIEGGGAIATMFVSAYNHPFILDAQSAGDWRLGDVSDGDFNNAKINIGGKQEKIYDFVVLNSTHYPGLIPKGFIGSNYIETVATDAVLVASPEFVEKNKKKFENLYRVAGQVIPNFKARYNIK